MQWRHLAKNKAGAIYLAKLPVAPFITTLKVTCRATATTYHKIDVNTLTHNEATSIATAGGSTEKYAAVYVHSCTMNFL